MIELDAFTVEQMSAVPNPTASSTEQTASGNYIAQASNYSSASVTQVNLHLTINGVGQLVIPGSLLPNSLLGLTPESTSSTAITRDQNTTLQHMETESWTRGQLVYALDLSGNNEQIKANLQKWQFASSSQRQPHAAIAGGVIGIGQYDGVTFNCTPVAPIKNCSVECELRIINYGDDMSNWGGIRVRGFDFCPDFRLGYMVYLRQQRTVDLYGPYGVIDGDKEVKTDSADPFTRLRIDVFDSQIRVYINDDLRISRADENFGNKGFIYLHTFRTHTEFRNLRIYEMTR